MMKSDILTIVIPVKSSPDIVKLFIEGNKDYLKKYKVVVVDSGGGAALKKYADIYKKENLSMSDARRLGYVSVKTKYIMNLDCDVIIPEDYIENALKIFEADGEVATISIFFDNIIHNAGALEYGVSIWKADVLKKLYKYREGKPECECIYMWHRILLDRKKMETLPCRAVHLKEMSEWHE